MRCASALSTQKTTEAAITEIVERTATDLGGESADLAVVFASAHHAEGLAGIVARIKEKGLGRHVLGCTGESIVGDGEEVEETPALCLWSACLPGVGIHPLRLTFEDGTFSDLPEEVRSSLLVLGDPFGFPADEFLKQVNRERRGLQLFGGMASGGQSPGTNRLILDGETYEDGAVAVGIEGPVVLRTVVSQGCRPIGRPLIAELLAKGHTVTALTRSPEKAQSLLETGIEPAVADSTPSMTMSAPAGAAALAVRLMFRPATI